MHKSHLSKYEPSNLYLHNPHGNNEHGNMKFKKKNYIKWFLFFMSCEMSKYGM